MCLKWDYKMYINNNNHQNFKSMIFLNNKRKRNDWSGIIIFELFEFYRNNEKYN